MDLLRVGSTRPGRRVVIGRQSRRQVAWVVTWSLVATMAWALSGAPAPVVAADDPPPSHDVRPVAPLPSTAGERDLDEASGDEAPATGAADLLARAEHESAFDPETSVLVESATTETRAVYDNVDGTRTAVLSPGPVRFEEDGEWREIDLALTEEGGEIVPAASPADVTFPADAADGVAVHESAAGPITVGLPSVVADGDEGAIDEGATYQPDHVVVTGDGVDSVVTPLSTGFEHDIVFADRVAAERAFTVEIEVPAGVLAVDDATGVALRHGDTTVAHYGGGVAFDAGIAHGAGDDVAVATDLVGQAGTTVTVRVSVDQAWLADAARQFPVTIDPTYTSTIGATPGGGDTYVNNGAPSTSMASAVDLRVGRDGSGNVYRTFVRFGVGGIPAGAVIYDADMELVNFSSTSCTPSLVRARQLTSSFGSTTTWNTQPTVSGSIVSDTTFAKGATGCPGGWQAMDATSAVNDWYANPSGNLGIRLSADEATTAGYKRFYSSSFGSGMSPKLTVTYDRLAPEPTRAAPADGARIPTTTPTLSVNPVTDPDGEAVTYGFYVWAGDGLPLAGQITRSHSLSTTSWTVPQGVLADGVTYAWAAWARGGGGWFTQPTTSGTFTVDRRLDGDPAPTEEAGPVTVNLATGDAGVATGSPGVSALGGGIAPGYRYHSTDTPETGLTGAYYIDANSNAVIDEAATMVRTDSMVSHDWSSVTPFDGLPDEQYMVRWSGFVTVPTADTYYFGASGSNGFKVIVNGTTVVNRWPGPWAFTPAYGTGTTLTAGQTVPITVEMLDTAGDGAHINLAYKTSTVTDLDVPSSWLTPARRTGEELSPGWELDLGGSAPAWETVRASDDAITAYGADGSTLEFDRTPGGGFVAADGSDATAALDTAGLVTIQQDGTTYAFEPDGTLGSATDGPVADSTLPLYTWATTTTGGVTYRRIATITDPVSNQQVAVTWRLPGATCPTAPSGFDANPPTGSLCKIAYWDGTTTSYFYKSGQLARIVDPGGSTQDFGYTNGLLTSVRDPLAHDAVARGVRADDATTLTQITYASGKATKVTLPAPTTGAQRPETTITYGSGTTDVAVAGATNGSGYTRRVTYDASGRLLTDTDVNGKTATITWSATVDDEVLAEVDGLGAMTTFHYDVDGLPTDSYGPAPAAWFGSDRLPLPAHVAAVPHHVVDYDDGTTGLAVSWYGSGNLSGAPVAEGHGTGGTWATSPTGSVPFSGRYTGSITFPAAGTYTLTLTKNSRARLWVDGTLVVDGWASAGNASSSFGPVVAGSTHSIRIDVASAPSGTSSLALAWTVPGNPSAAIPGSALAPRFDNVTETTADGVTQDVDYGADADAGLPETVTTDPAGEQLTDELDFEPEGTGWRRLLARTLPGGAATTYAYYGGTETRDNPCTVASDPAIQGGRLKTATAPTPGSGSAVVDEVVYDSSGRTVAQRKAGGSWTCVTYDGRGRTVKVEVPSYGAAPARTVEIDPAVGGSGGVVGDGDPLLATTTDAAGTVTSRMDLLGRVVEGTDVHGVVSETTYDRPGRATSRETTVGATTWTTTAALRSDGQPTSLDLDGDRISDVSYGADMRPSAIAFPDGTGDAGNGTSIDGYTYGIDGSLLETTWRDATGAVMSNEAIVVRDGRVRDHIVDGSDATPTGDSFTYDTAGRLVSESIVRRNPATGAPIGGVTVQQYGFDPVGGCSGGAADPGRNGNRTSLTVDGVVTATYCYDDADRLTSTTASGYTSSIAYDGRGSTTTIGGETRDYDGSGRHWRTVDGATTVTYERDALDRIVERKVNGTTIARYAYDGPTDDVVAVLDGGGALLRRLVDLPGGVAYSDAGPSTSSTWAYTNSDGAVQVTADGAGAKVGPTRTYDAFGVALTDLADTAPGNLDSGWVGRDDRPLEHETGLLPTIEMGARSYDPRLGRFLSVDPVDGGSCNAYDYACADPVNSEDHTGTLRLSKNNVCAFGRCITVGIRLRFSRGESLGLARLYGKVAGKTAWIGAAKGLLGVWGIAGKIGALISNKTLGAILALVFVTWQIHKWKILNDRKCYEIRTHGVLVYGWYGTCYG